MTVFDDMIDAVIEDGVTESAVVDHYFLVDYPYPQGRGSPDGECARSCLDNFFRKFQEVAPPGWSGTVKAMKKHMTTKQAFRRAWSMRKKGATPHYKEE
jgi:hypothetical protein